MKLIKLLCLFGVLIAANGCWESDAENAAEDVVEQAEETGETIGDHMENARERVGNALEDVADKTEEHIEHAKDQIDQVKWPTLVVGLVPIRTL